MFKNGYLRLLVKLIGLTSIGAADDPEASWHFPPAKTADQIKEASDLIKKFEFAPPTFDDGKGALDQIRRVSAGINRKRSVFDESDDGIDNDDEEEELLFEPGGPTAMKKSDALKALKKSRRRRRKEGSEESESRGLTDEQIDARAAARRARELEKNRKIKSELYVHDSDEDEENDRIFFEAEERLRQQNKINIMKELLGVGQQKENGKKRMAGALDREGDGDSDEDVAMTPKKKRGSSAISLDSDEEVGAGADDLGSEEEEAENMDTPISSRQRSAQSKRRKVLSDDDDDVSLAKDAMEVDDEDEENIIPVANPRRPRVRAGFIMDSSDDE